MKPWAKEMMYTKKGAKLAEQAMPHALKVAALLPIRAEAYWVLFEAWFRLHELPKRTEQFQRKYKKENGIK